MSRSLLLTFALFFSSTCFWLPAAVAWGGQGHNATARLAQSLFTPAATQLTSLLLPDKAGQIDTISSWADNVRDLTNYSWSYGMHFVNTPDFVCNYEPARDCQYQGVPGRCVDTAVKNYTQRMGDVTLDDYHWTGTQHREALEFFVHFVGDLHQPLHAGFAGDLGGNQIRVNWTYGYSNNLHSLWDSGLILRRVALNFSSSYAQWDDHLMTLLQTTYKDDVAAWLSCDNGSGSGSDSDVDIAGGSDGSFPLSEYVPCSAKWVQESAELCCQTVYVDEQGNNMTKGALHTLGDDYYERNIDTVERRIVQAGVRMAYVINTMAASILPQLSSSSSSSSASSSSSSSSGEHEPDDRSSSTVEVAVAVIVVLLVLVAAVFGFLYWRKRKYGLNSLFESAGGGRAPDRRSRMLLDDDDSSTSYTRA